MNQHYVRAVERPLYKTVVNAYQKAAMRGWDRIYWAIDIHDTLYPSTYQKDEAKTLKPFFGARTLINNLIGYKENVIILWSSLLDGGKGPNATNDFQPYFDDLFGDYEKAELRDRVFFNENPLEKDTEYACFAKKFYFNVLLDDKAGFDPEIDFYAIKLAMNHCREIYIGARGLPCVQ